MKNSLVLAGLLLATPALGSEEDAEACLRTKVWDRYDDGWSIRTMNATTLNKGTTRNYLVTLYKGNEYQVLACADSDATNIDLILYDLNGEVVMRDEDKGRTPEYTFKPTATGTYYVVVHARSLSADKAGVAVAVTYR